MTFLIFGREHAGRALQHFQLFLALRIVDHHHEHEAVELGFGQRISPFLLDGVLRGQHEERVGQVERLPAGGHLVFLHRLEQGGLGLGRGAVDFVGQQQVGENRPLQELKSPAAGIRVFLEHVGAGDVRGHQVRRELDSPEGQVHRSAPALRRASSWPAPAPPAPRNARGQRWR